MNIYINTGTKWAALTISAAVLVLSPFDGAGICVGCSWWARLSYPIFHVNFLHAFCNAWCLLSLVFYYDHPAWKLMAAYAIAVTIPAFALSTTPAVGLSGLCFALMGMTVYVVLRKVMFVGWTLAFLAVGFLFHNVAVWLHIYCFAAGLVAGLFTSPLPWLRRK